MDRDERLRLLGDGRVAFNRGEFYEAHEHWEDVWNALDDDRERRWVQGLIQVATGLHKLTRGRPDVCATLLTKALGKLDGSPPTLDGLDLAAAKAGAARILAALGRGETPLASSLTLPDVSA